MVVAVVPLFLYLFRLGVAPVHLTHDEVVFALNAHTIATTGRGADGTPWPLYAHIVDNFYGTPLVVYFPALLQLFFAPTPTIVRLFSAVVGTIDVVLVYFTARRLFQSELVAVITASMLALTPAHLIHSRLGVDPLYPAPLFVAALLCVLRYDDLRKPGWLVGAGAMLGIGMYSYIGAMAANPLYLLLFVTTVSVAAPQALQRASLIVAGFAIAALPLLLWLLSHPNQFGQQVNMYSLAATDNRGMFRGLLHQFNYLRMVEHLRVYHEFFNPSYLFFSGDASVIDSTRRSGVFLVPTAVFLVVGVNAIINRARTRTSKQVLFSMLIAPVSALLVGEVKVNRALILMPAATLVSGYGIAEMLRWRRRWAKPAVMLLLAATVVQFAYFYWDYHGDYRYRTGYWFERNRYGAFDRIASVMESRPSLTFYVPETPQWVYESWRLYLAQHGRDAWLQRTHRFVPAQESIPADAVGMLAVEPDGTPTAGSQRDHDAVMITELDGTPTFQVFVPRTR
jgi:4-amino-4-deoxy-L-arabinose transferase-like glycosyltransferase